MAQIGLDARDDLAVRVTRGAAGDLHLITQMTEDRRTDTVRVFLGFSRDDIIRAVTALDAAAAQAHAILDTWT